MCEIRMAFQTNIDQYICGHGDTKWQWEEQFMDVL